MILVDQLHQSITEYHFKGIGEKSPFTDMDDFKLALVANGIWICFTKEPDIYNIQEARRLLDQLTDQLIEKKINVPTSAQ